VSLVISARLNLLLNPRTTFGPFIFLFKDGDGVPIDLTDWTVWAQAYYKVAGGGCPRRLDLAPVITDAVNGEVTIYITDENTSTIPEGDGAWDMLLQNTDGEILGPYVAGAFTVKRPVTNPD
jgi:hypothetical protein